MHTAAVKSAWLTVISSTRLVSSTTPAGHSTAALMPAGTCQTMVCTRDLQFTRYHPVRQCGLVTRSECCASITARRMLGGALEVNGCHERMQRRLPAQCRQIRPRVAMAACSELVQVHVRVQGQSARVQLQDFLALLHTCARRHCSRSGALQATTFAACSCWESTWESGRPTATSRSRRPSRLRAGSIAFALFVAPINVSRPWVPAWGREACRTDARPNAASGDC